MINDLTEYLNEQLTCISESGLELEEDFIEALINTWINMLIDKYEYSLQQISAILNESVLPNCQSNSIADILHDIIVDLK